MRTFISLLILFFLAVAHPASCANELIAGVSHTTIVSSNASEITLNFNTPDITKQEVFNDNGACDLYSIPDEAITNEYGKPVLPVIIRFVVVPPNVGLDFDFRVGETRYEQSTSSPTLCLDEEIEGEVGGFSQFDNGLYPPIVAEMSEPIVIRGVRLVKVSTYPVQYNFETNTYLRHEDIETEIRFTDDEPINPARVPVRRNRSREFLNFINALAINGDVVGRDDPDRDIEPEYVGHYAIVTHESCLEYAAPFIEWRRKAG